MSIEIRRAVKTECNMISEVFGKVIVDLPYYNKAAQTNEVSKYTPEALAKKIEEDADSILVAVENEAILGLCFSRFDDTLIWLEWFAVEKEARGKGIASLLIDTLESSVKGRNAHKIWCDCRTENLKSARLLSSRGYLPLCTVTNHWYNQDFILWQKSII